MSVAVHGNLAYVLNAEGGGSIQGYFIGDRGVSPVPSWNRALGLGTTSTSAFTSTPGEVAFSPNGNQLLVTTKNSTNAIDVFNLGSFGAPSATPVVNSEPATVPFGVAFDEPVKCSSPKPVRTRSRASGLPERHPRTR